MKKSLFLVVNFFMMTFLLVGCTFTKTEGNIITVDLENSGGRNYPEEGLDREIEFDITNVEKEVISTSEYMEDRECRIRTGLTVFITYYEQNGKNIVTKISTDNDEKERIVYVFLERYRNLQRKQ